MSIYWGLTDKVASIRQCIKIILTTSRGDVPFRPRFGLSPENLLDGRAKPVDISYEVIDQISRYEKRVKVKKVNVEDIALGQKRVSIHYTILEQEISDILTLEL